MSKESYSYDISQYPDILARCLASARRLIGTTLGAEITDIRMWVQKWPSTDTGFATIRSNNKVTLAPTVLVKINKNLRYVFHDGAFAYKIEGPVSIRYYDAVSARNLPGANDLEKLFLAENNL